MCCGNQKERIEDIPSVCSLFAWFRREKRWEYFSGSLRLALSFTSSVLNQKSRQIVALLFLNCGRLRCRVSFTESCLPDTLHNKQLDGAWSNVIARDCAWLGVIGPYETGSRQKTSVIHRDSPWFTVIHRDSLCFMATSIDFQDFKASPHTITFFCVDIRQIDLCLEQTNRVIDLIEKQSWMKLHVPNCIGRGGERISSPKNQMDFQPTHISASEQIFGRGLIRPKDARRAFLLPSDGKYCFRSRSHKWPNSKRIQHSQPPECPIESLYTSKHQSTRTWHSMYPRLQVWNIQIVKQKTYSV